MLFKKLVRRYGLISICLLQTLCTVGFADDLRDLLLPWDTLVANGLGPSPIDLRNSRLTGKKPEFTYFFALRDKVSHLPDLSKAELEEIIKYKELLARQLLLEINERNLSTLSGLLTSKIEDGTFNANKAYGAAFIARYVVNMDAARDAARGAARGAAWDAARGAAWDAARGAAWAAAWDAARGAAWAAARDAARGAAWGAARDAAVGVLKTTLPILKEVDPTKLGQKAYALSELVVLNWLIENSATYYQRTFQAAYDSLDGSITIAQTKEIIERNINAASLAGNPFIIELKYFLDESEAEIGKLLSSLPPI